MIRDAKSKPTLQEFFPVKFTHIASHDLLSAFCVYLCTLVAYIVNNMDSDQKGA